MAEQLHRKGLSVQLVELQDQVIPPLDAPMAVLESELRHNGVELFLGNGASASLKVMAIMCSVI